MSAEPLREPSAAAPEPVVIVLTTLPLSADADAFANALVDEKLAACVSIGAESLSVYRWKDAIERAGERQLMLKTVRGNVPLIKARLSTLHPYEVPELLVIETAGGSDAYLSWVRQCTRA